MNSFHSRAICGYCFGQGGTHACAAVQGGSRPEQRGTDGHDLDPRHPGNRLLLHLQKVLEEGGGSPTEPDQRHPAFDYQPACGRTARRTGTRGVLHPGQLPGPRQ